MWNTWYSMKFAAVTTETAQLPLLENLTWLGNNLKIAALCSEVKEIEPHQMYGIRVFTTGIVNYKQVCQKYAELIRSQGGECQY